MEQAAKIIELRPYGTVDRLNTKLSQGKKKAGPAGISPRIFEDCIAILEGYAKVDKILAECEAIGAELKLDITKWTRSGSVAGKSKSRDSSETPDIFDDGSLSLRSDAVIRAKSNDFLSSQPSLVSSSVTLKDYQLIGVNWLHLLYRKHLSCILADEMGTWGLFLVNFELTSSLQGLAKPSRSSVSLPISKSADAKARTSL